MQSVSRPPFQQQPHRQQPPPNPNQQQHVGAPREIYYTQPGPSNRLILSLLSPDADSIDWALNQLVRLSASPFFDLTAWPQALSALLRHPLQLIEFGQSNRGGLASSQQASLWEAGLGAGELVVEMRRRATESLLVLKNAGVVNDKANGELLGESSRLMSFVEDLLTFDRDVLLDHLVEPLLLSLDILYNIATSAHPSSLLRSSCNSTSLPAALIPLLDKTQNAAVLLALFRLINAVTVPNEHSSSSRNNPNNNPTQLIRKRPREADSDSDPDSSQPVPQLSAQVSPFVPLSHPTLPPAFLHKSLLILALPPYPRNQLIRSAALDFLYTYTTHSHHASVLLQRSDVGAIFRLLARGLFEGCVEKEVKMPDVRDIEEHEGPLTPEEIRYLTKMAEPARSKAWIKRVWASAPLTSQVAQVVFWQDYRATFQALPAGSPPLSTASEIIRLFTDSIETARPATIKDFNGPGLDGYVIQGVQKKTAIPMDHSGKFSFLAISFSADPMSFPG
jgi:chromatin structure-remodeling complex subunit RSC9